jgi:hypothetical protein
LAADAVTEKVFQPAHSSNKIALADASGIRGGIKIEEKIFRQHHTLEPFHKSWPRPAVFLILSGAAALTMGAASRPKTGNRGAGR